MNNIFNIFFKELNCSEIPYAITGRTEKYPDDIHSDIDIIISPNKYVAFWMFMSDIQKYKIDWIQIITHEITAHYCIVTLSNGYEHHILKPDVCSDYYRRGTLFLKADYLLQNRIYNSKGFYQLAPNKEFVYYLLKKIDKEYISEEQFRHLKSQWNEDKVGCKNAIKPFFTVRNQTFIEQVFNHNNINLLNSNLIILKMNLHQNLSFSIKDYFFKIRNRIERIIKPTGLVIAFMGPDGSGKSSIINAVKEDLTEVFRKNKQFHLFPKESSETATNTNPHGLKQRGFLCSLLKLFYFLGLYTIGYWSKVYPLKIRSTLIIFDRYFHDILIDPKRYRHSGGKIWIKLIGTFIPKPDLWILLDAPAEVIQQRKTEVTFEETSFQVNEYRKLFNNLSNAIIINANQPLQQVIYDTEKAIIEHLKKRTLDRYRK